MGYNEYNFFQPATAIRDFTWNVFAAQYIEMVKARAYGIGFTDEERDGAIFTLHKVLSIILKSLAPITPFITEHLWLSLYSDQSIHKEGLPDADDCIMQINNEQEIQLISADEMVELQDMTVPIFEFNSKVWNEKKQNNLSLKDSIKIDIPENLNQFKKDLIAMHNLETS